MYGIWLLAQSNEVKKERKRVYRSHIWNHQIFLSPISPEWKKAKKKGFDCKRWGSNPRVRKHGILSATS